MGYLAEFVDIVGLVHEQWISDLSCFQRRSDFTKEYTDLLRQADHIYIDELHKHNLYDEVRQVFAGFLPVRSVGVDGVA
jgi:hypothetical protein